MDNRPGPDRQELLREHGFLAPISRRYFLQAGLTASLGFLLGLRVTSQEATGEPVGRPRRDPLTEVDVLVVGSGPAGLA
ncbi:MAG TPA: hypothetical protein VNO81_03995, partial [Candidatus Nitrosotenuis sp.]|nr:hypothetical protein [Candidatus Nitrosotenuis sp.]